MNKYANMKFCVTPTSQFRSTPNVMKYHFEGSMRNWNIHKSKVLSLIADAVAEGVVLEIGNFEDTERSPLYWG